MYRYLGINSVGMLGTMEHYSIRNGWSVGGCAWVGEVVGCGWVDVAHHSPDKWCVLPCSVPHKSGHAKGSVFTIRPWKGNMAEWERHRSPR